MKLANLAWWILTKGSLNGTAVELIPFKHAALLRTYQTLGYKGSISIFQMAEIIQSLFSNHGAIELKINKNNRNKLEISHII